LLWGRLLLRVLTRPTKDVAQVDKRLGKVLPAKYGVFKKESWYISKIVCGRF